MNRLQLSADAPSKSWNAPRDRHRLEASSASSSQFVSQSFFVPLHYEPNYAYPLVVWLHGACDDHHQLKRVMPHVSVRNYVAVAPGSPAGDDELDATWDQATEGIHAAWEVVDAAIEQAKTRFHVAPHRVFLAGVDEGGSMALRLGMAAPDRFAGVASIGGAFPSSLQPMSNLVRARKLPLLISHGRDSEIYPIHRLCDELRLFHVAGMTINVRQYPCGHELTTQMLSDLDVWLMQIVTGVDMSGRSSATADSYLPRSGSN